MRWSLEGSIGWLGSVHGLVILPSPLVSNTAANPALRLFAIVGSVPGGSVDPPDRTVLAKEQAVIGAEFVVVGGKAGIDLGELFFLGIVESNLLVAALEREVLGKLVAGAGLAKIGLFSP